MSRPLSALAKAAALAGQTGEAYLLLLVLSHPSLAQPIRVVNDGTNLTSGGDLYVAYPFRVVLPQDGDDRPARVRLQIDNVDQSIVAAVRAMTTAPTVAISVVLASTPNVVEAGPFQFTLKNAAYDALSVEGELSYEALLDEPYPADAFTPGNFPGLF